MDSASTGDVPAQIAAHTAALPNARLVRLDQRGVSLARNAAAASGEYVAYIDDEAIPAEDWVETIQLGIVAQLSLSTKSHAQKSHCSKMRMGRDDAER